MATPPLQPAGLLGRLCADCSSLPLTMVIAAHPDDEVVGAGSRLPLLPSCRVVHLTDGAPHDPRFGRAAGFATREAYRDARRRELEEVLALAGIAAEQACWLGVVDQEASRELVSLTRDLLARFRAEQPAAVITHPYEGGHPDHDAAAFAVHAACALLRDAGEPVPVLLEMTSYHNSGGAMATGGFLAGTGAPARMVVLSPEARALKKSMFDRYVSQRAVLSAFSVDSERFRPAPPYDFGRPPHDGRLWYECFDWGMTGAQWRDLAQDACRELGLPAAPLARTEREPC